MPRPKKVANEKLPSKRISCDEERETIIRLEKLNELANIYSSDKPTISELKKNKYAKLVREDNFGAEFEIDKKHISIATTKGVRAKKHTTESKCDS